MGIIGELLGNSTREGSDNMSKVKVVIAHPADPFLPAAGGSLRFVLEMTKHLAAEGIEVTLLGVRQGGTIRYEQENVVFRPVARILGRWQVYLFGVILKAPFLRLPRNAIIHVQRMPFLLPFLIFYPGNPMVLRAAGIPLELVRLHHPRLYKASKMLYGIIEYLVMRRVDLVLAPIGMAEFFKARYPHDWFHRKVRLLPSGVNLSKFRPMDRLAARRRYGIGADEKVLLFAGRLERVKGLRFLLEAFSYISKQIQCRLVIAGAGSEFEYLKGKVDELQMKSVLFLGDVKPDHIHEVFNCADLLLLTSESEASPLVVREALACGVPVVTTDVGDVREVLNSESIGRVVRRDVHTFAETVVQWLSKPASERIREECRSRATDYSYEKIFRTIGEMYSQLASYRGERRGGRDRDTERDRDRRGERR